MEPIPPNLEQLEAIRDCLLRNDSFGLIEQLRRLNFSPKLACHLLADPDFVEPSLLKLRGKLEFERENEIRAAVKFFEYSFLYDLYYGQVEMKTRLQLQLQPEVMKRIAQRQYIFTVDVNVFMKKFRLPGASGTHMGLMRKTEFDKYDVIFGICQALEFNDIDGIHHVFSYHRAENDSFFVGWRSFLEKWCRAAAKRGYYDAVKLVCSLTNIDRVAFRWIEFANAAKAGNIDLVKRAIVMFISKLNCDIDVDGMENVLKAAIKYGHTTIVRLLLSQSFIRQFDRAVMRFFAKNGDIAAIKKNFTLYPMDYRNIALYAVACNNVNILQFALPGLHRDLDRIRLFCRAVHCRSFDAAKYMFNYIRDNERNGLTALAACYRGPLDDLYRVVGRKYRLDMISLLLSISAHVGYMPMYAPIFVTLKALNHNDTITVEYMMMQYRSDSLRSIAERARQTHHYKYMYLADLMRVCSDVSKVILLSVADSLSRNIIPVEHIIIVERLFRDNNMESFQNLPVVALRNNMMTLVNAIMSSPQRRGNFEGMCQLASSRGMHELAQQIRRTKF